MEGIYAVLDAVLPLEALQFSFMKNAFLAILLLTPCWGLLGTMAVQQQMAFFLRCPGAQRPDGHRSGHCAGVEQ